MKCPHCGKDTDLSPLDKLLVYLESNERSAESRVQRAKEREEEMTGSEKRIEERRRKQFEKTRDLWRSRARALRELLRAKAGADE